MDLQKKSPVPTAIGHGAKDGVCGSKIAAPPANSNSAAAALPIVVAEWDRNSREVVRVSLDRFNGCNTIDVRTWYRAADGSPRPSKSGITLSIKHLPAMAAALAQALARAAELGLLGDGGGDGI
jgi:hypothetical protein